MLMLAAGRDTSLNAAVNILLMRNVHKSRLPLEVVYYGDKERYPPLEQLLRGEWVLRGRERSCMHVLQGVGGCLRWVPGKRGPAAGQQLLRGEWAKRGREKLTSAPASRGRVGRLGLRKDGASSCWRVGLRQGAGALRGGSKRQWATAWWVCRVNLICGWTGCAACSATQTACTCKLYMTLFLPQGGVIPLPMGTALYP
jgi:hypothetical protein